MHYVLKADETLQVIQSPVFQKLRVKVCIKLSV